MALSSRSESLLRSPAALTVCEGDVAQREHRPLIITCGFIDYFTHSQRDSMIVCLHLVSGRPKKPHPFLQRTGSFADIEEQASKREMWVKSVQKLLEIGRNNQGLMPKFGGRGGGKAASSAGQSSKPSSANKGFRREEETTLLCFFFFGVLTCLVINTTMRH